MDHEPPQNLNSKINLQRSFLFWEKIWAALHRPLLVLGLALAILTSGALEWLPKWAQASVLVVLVLTFLFTFISLITLKSVSRLAAMRRIEEQSAFDHRQLSSQSDTRAAEETQPEADTIWEEHKRRQLAALENIRLASPKSHWRLFDPTAIRVPVALAAFAAIMLGTGDLFSNAKNAFNFAPSITIPRVTLDAWLKPPGYTGKQPILLTSAAMREKLQSSPEILAPENSSLSIRLQGGTNSRLAFYSPESTATAETEIKSIHAQVASSDQGFSAEVKLDRPATVKLFDDNKEMASWAFNLIPDEAPKIKIVDEPKANPGGALSVHWRASDDYGIKSITAEISLADEQENGIGFEGNGVFLYDPPKFKIALQKPNAKSEDTTTKQDLSAHPWAGLYAEVILTATDAAGHSTATEPKRFKMPERGFYRFLSKSIVEQRKKLILSPDDAPDVATILDAILAYPYSLRDQSRLILNLAVIKSSLSKAGETDDIKSVVGKMWDLAIAIEDGKLNDTRAELRNLKEQLEQALRDGAPPERIAELTDKMRRAMDKLLDEMRKEAEKRAADGEPQPNAKGKSVTREDLQKMLDAIEQMNKGGSKDAARDMLSQLDQLLQNLQPGMSSEAGKEGDQELQQKLDGLSDLMRRQQQLMDQTQKLPQPGEGDQPPDKPDDGSGALADRQGSLSDMLDRLNKQLGPDGQGELGDASKNMKGAKGALKQGDKLDALRQQGEAMRQMQEGAQKLGKKLAEQGKGKAGQQGKEGEAGGKNDDPLGRPRATRNPDTGPDKNMVPSELSMRRAREILESLRGRYDDPNLGSGEKAYIDRLLRGLY